MAYIDDGGFFSPICKHFIDLEKIRATQWLQCPCGNWFNYSLLVDLESAKSRLEVAQDDVRFLQAEVARVSLEGERAGVKRFIKSVVHSFRSAEGLGPNTAETPNIRVVAPTVSKYSKLPETVAAPISDATGEALKPQASVSATIGSRTSVSASDASPSASRPYVPHVSPTPVAPPKPKVPERPRGLAATENRRQIGLFITAVTMAMVAFLSYFAWGAQPSVNMPAEIQVPIGAVVVIGLGIVSVRSRKYSRVLANVLAITSSVLALVSLWALSYYGVWGISKDLVGSSWRSYPYVALIPFILGALTIYPGYRFKIAGWLNPTAVLFAISGAVFNLTYQSSTLGFSGEACLGWQLIALTATMVLVVVASRFSRAKLDELPDSEAVEKLVGAPEADRRAYWELVERHREQNLLNRLSRSSLLGLLALMAIHTGLSGVSLIGGARLDGFGLLVLGLVWIAISVGVETIGGQFTVSGSVATPIRRGSWILGLGGLGLGVSTMTLNAEASFNPSNIWVLAVSWLLGSVLLFAPKVIAVYRENKEFGIAANLAAFVVWVSWFAYGIANQVFNNAGSFSASAVYALLIALTLTALNFLYKVTSFQIGAVFASSAAALLSLGSSRISADSSAPVANNALAIVISLAIINAFTVANAFVTKRAGADSSRVVQSISSAANIVAVFAAMPAVLGTLYDANHQPADATLYWPILIVLILFAGGLLVVPNLGFASKSDSILTAESRRTLTLTSVLYLGAGFINLVTLANNPHIFPTVTAYTFAVMLVVLSYGYIRRAVWAITTSYGLSTIFSIALGEAAMLYQNAEQQGNTITWSMWFLIPFALLTYLHLLILRVRADASVVFKVALGVGGFALTSLVYEVTRATNAQLVPAGSSSRALHDYLLNRDINVATLLGLGALVLLLRISPAVRKDVARDQVLNLSGLLALALALLDSFTTVADAWNATTHYIALGAVTLLLLVNARTSVAAPQVVAAFFAGQLLLIPALGSLASALVSYTSITGGNVDIANALVLSAPALAFLLTLLWFALVQKLAPSNSLSEALKVLTLPVAAIVASISMTAIGWPTNVVTGTSRVEVVSSLPAASHETLAFTLVAISGATLYVLFIWRWISRKSNLHLGVMGSGLIVWLVGIANALTAAGSDSTLTLWATLLLIPSVALLLDSLITRTAVGTIVALTPLMASSWILGSLVIVDGHSHFAVWNLLIPAVAFALATLVLRAIKALESVPLWFGAITPIVIISVILEVNSAVALPNDVVNQIDWPATLLIGVVLLVVSQRIGSRIPTVANTSILVSSAVLWGTGASLLWFTNDHTNAFGGRSIDWLIYFLTTAIALTWHAIAAKSNVLIGLAPVSVISAVAELSVINDDRFANTNIFWISNLAISLAMLAALGLFKNRFTEPSQRGLWISSAIVWLTGYGILWSQSFSQQIAGGITLVWLIYFVITLVALFWHSLATKSRALVALAPVALLSGVVESGYSSSVGGPGSVGTLQSDAFWISNLAISLLLLAISAKLSDRLVALSRRSVNYGTALVWLSGLIIVAATHNRGILISNELVEVLLYVAVSTVAIFWHSLSVKSLASVALGAIGSIASGIMFDSVAHDTLHTFAGPELGSLVVALGLAFAAFAYGKIAGAVKNTLWTWGTPTAALLWPSVVYTFSSNQISQPWNELATDGIVRLIALALVGTIVLLTGLRAGNRGLVYASVVTLLFEFVPALWFGIGNLFAGDTHNVVTEVRGFLVAVTIYVVQGILKRVINLKINSLLVWGVPAIITLAPTLIDAWAALGTQVSSADWVRFVVLVSISTAFLVIGAIRRLSGLFYPGFFGAIAAVLPYAFGAGGGLWIVGALVVLTALIIWVAVRIDKFTGWLKELQ